ncbi:30S ribosomal protein S6 [Mesorhizobium sp. ANAO-SY3R2]|uniref:30S ribosomal protein S6 n=1 Tax=Mesorhizobium sp. ANAO-SY3R2 TaxID=3166644 RepID=UPI00366F30B6
MALYEHVFLARQDLSQQQVDALVEHYKGIITAAGGSVGRVENWGLKSLTYRINKNRKAYYTLMDITAPSAAVKEVERQQGLSEDILRFMTIKVEAHEEGVSAMMQKREERSERGDRGFGDRPRSFGDRDRGDRGPRSFGDREGGDRGPRRPREGVEGGAE